MDSAFADQLLEQVTQAYDAIADHFAITRQKPWAEFSALQQLLPPDAKLLDVGCGNGRLAAAAQAWSVDYVGLDVSVSLLTVARRAFPSLTFVTGNMLALPLPEAEFHCVAAIASLQHIPSAAYRLKTLQEYARVTRPRGVLFMMNWNLFQPELQRHFVQHDPRFDTGDALVPWKDAHGQLQAQRYYHGFTIPELNELCAAAGWDMQTQYYAPQGQPADQTTGHNLVTIAHKK